MMRRPLLDIVRLTEAQHDAEQAKMNRIIAEENKVLRELSNIDERVRKSRELQDRDVTGLREIGADILWQSWVGNRRRQLQIRLAQVLSRKAAALHFLRQTHGRRTAAEKLLVTQTKSDRAQGIAKSDRDEHRLSLLRAMKMDHE